MLLNFLRKYLIEREKNQMLIKLLKLHSVYLKKYPNLIAPVFDYITTCCSVFGIYEKDELECIEELLNKHCKNKNIIDCGANFGNHTLFFSKFAQKVYSFEPNNITYECLRLNTMDIKNIKIYNYGLSNKKIRKKLFINNQNLGATSIKNKKNSKSILANFRKLDSFTEILKKKISLIKIDVEDSEFQLLTGAKRILKKNNIILFEVSNYKRNDRFFKILKNEFGYNFLYVLKKKTLKQNVFFKTIRKIYFIYKNKDVKNNFKITLANSVSERSGNSHFAIIAKNELF
jgi:FkbM family methyltransferase